MEREKGNRMMDIRQLLFPFIMAVLTNSLMIVAIYFLRKSKRFANLFGVEFMIVLYLFCIVRAFFPIEFASVQIIIMDEYVYTGIIEFLKGDYIADGSYRYLILYILIAVWAVGTVAFSVASFISQRRFRRYIEANGDYSTERERELLSDVKAEIFKNGRADIRLRKTDAVLGPMVVGLIRKELLIPDREYDEGSLKMILRHECTHIRNRDLWLKLLIQIYCCIFWWNPFAYLLKRDLNFSLEMKCDLSVVKERSDEYILTYIETLKENAQEKKTAGQPFVVCAELSNSVKGRELVKRVKAITSEKPKKSGQIIMNTAVIILFIAVFLASYLFIWQPFYGFDAPNDNYEMIDESGYISDDTNCYLVKQPDGSYLFYFSDFPPMEVSQEEFEEGLFEGYPVYE